MQIDKLLNLSQILVLGEFRRVKEGKKESQCNV